MQKFKYALFLLFFLSILSVSAYSEPISVKKGRWSWSMTMNIMGMQTSSFNYSHCISEKDLVPQQQKKGENCKILNTKFYNNTVTWKVVCQSEAGESVSTGKIKYTNTTADGEINTSTQGMNINSKISGKYIGDCD